jgi:hypothetical protein
MVECHMLLSAYVMMMVQPPNLSKSIRKETHQNLKKLEKRNSKSHVPVSRHHHITEQFGVAAIL